jgi:hypothetical protein
MMKRLNLEGLPIQVRELITMDFTRENPCPPPGVPLRDASPRRPAPAAPSPLGSPTLEPPTSNANPATKETGTKDRESNGRFAKGNRGGCGNPFARQVAAFRACLINSVTQDDFRAIVEQLLEMAKDGEIQAIKLLFSYLLGMPKPVVEPDELDLQEMHHAHQTAQAAQALQQAALARPASNDTSPPPDGLVEKPTTCEAEAPPPLASAPSTNHANREPCQSATGKAPSTNGVSDVSEPGKPSRPPSPNRANGQQAGGKSKTRPSPNRANGDHTQEPICGESLGRKGAAADEKRT